MHFPIPRPDQGPFRPPEIPTLVICRRCEKEFESYLIEWRQWREEDGLICGAWCCPTDGCGGIGFGMDLERTDPDFPGANPEPAWHFEDLFRDSADWPGDFFLPGEEENF